eukprot:Hpha_TRINITY_DN16629_c3_g11::TRINITY_DN16629_c3_g11_i1::g.183017::m.183017
MVTETLPSTQNTSAQHSTPVAPATWSFDRRPSGCSERKRSHSDARDRVNDLNPDGGEQKFCGSFGGAHASFLRERSDEDAIIPCANLASTLAPTVDTVSQLANRERDPFTVDSALVSDLICQVHRDRMRRNRRQQRAEEEPIASSPTPKQLAFTRVQSQNAIQSSEDALRAGAVESHAVEGATAGSSAVEVRTVSMLEVARRLRVSLSSLVWALALSDDRREVRLRDSPSVSRDGGSPQGTGASRSADLDPLLGGRYGGDSGTVRKPSLIMDINFNGECSDSHIHPTIVDDEAHDDSVSQPRYGETLRKISSQIKSPQPRVQAFGLALGPGARNHPPDRKPGKKNGFDAWRQGVLHPDDQAQRDGQVMVEVPEKEGKGHLSHEAYIVRDPSVMPGQPPQYVFAVPTMPEDISESRGKCGAYPDEIAAVTVYCDNPPGDRGLPLVVLSAHLAQPAFAWAALLVGTACLSCVGPAVARMKAHADGAVPAALWWATAEMVLLFVVLLVYAGVHRWTSAELLVFDTGIGSCFSRYAYCLVLILIGLSGGAAQLLWTYGMDAHARGHEADKGPPAQAAALSALHPLFIVGYRLCRKQRLFTGELIGVFGVLGGLALASYPVDGGHNSSWVTANVCAAASSVFTAAWLIACKVIAAQLPACVILVIASVPGVLVALVAAAVSGDLSSSSEVFRWSTDKTVAGWWVAVMCLGVASKLGLILSLRYMHTITVSTAACTAAVFSVFWCRYPFNVPVPGGVGNAVAVPGLLVCACGAMLAAYTNSTQRTHIELNVTAEGQEGPSPTGSANLPKRSRPATRLTSGLLEAKQREEHGGRTLYHDAMQGLRPPEPRVPRRQREPAPTPVA